MRLIPIVDARSSREVAPSERAQSWQSDFALAPRDRVILLKDPETDQVVAARWANFPSWRWMVFDPDPHCAAPGETWGTRVTEILDGWDDRLLPGLLWRHLPS